MEGNGSGLPYYFHHRLLQLPHGQGDPGVSFGDGGEASGMFPSSSSSSAAGDPVLFPQSAVAAAGGRASPLAPPPIVEPVRRKRGRPRKYGPAPSSTPPRPHPSSSSSAATAFSPPSGFSVNKVSSSPSLHLASSPPPRVAPGRKKAKVGSVDKGGQSFTPHLLTVAAGEDVFQQIMAFVQQQRRAVCIISASGTISSVTLRQPAMSGGHVTYEGHFDIVSLSGSFLISETGGAHSRTGALSVCLSNVHNVVGGGVSGPLVAAGPVQVIAGTFSIGSNKNLAAPPSMEKDALSKLSSPFPEPDVSPPVVAWSTADSTGRISNSMTDDHHEGTGGNGHSFMLQPRGVHAMPSRSSIDLGVRQESGLGAAFRPPEGEDDEHIHD